MVDSSPAQYMMLNFLERCECAACPVTLNMTILRGLYPNSAWCSDQLANVAEWSEETAAALAEAQEQLQVPRRARLRSAVVTLAMSLYSSRATRSGRLVAVLKTGVLPTRESGLLICQLATVCSVAGHAFSMCIETHSRQDQA